MSPRPPPTPPPDLESLEHDVLEHLAEEAGRVAGRLVAPGPAPSLDRAPPAPAGGGRGRHLRARGPAGGERARGAGSVRRGSGPPLRLQYGPARRHRRGEASPGLRGAPGAS